EPLERRRQSFDGSAEPDHGSDLLGEAEDVVDDVRLDRAVGKSRRTGDRGSADRQREADARQRRGGGDEADEHGRTRARAVSETDRDDRLNVDDSGHEDDPGRQTGAPADPRGCRWREYGRPAAEAPDTRRAGVEREERRGGRRDRAPRRGGQGRD